MLIAEVGIRFFGDFLLLETDFSLIKLDLLINYVDRKLETH